MQLFPPGLTDALTAVDRQDILLPFAFKMMPRRPGGSDAGIL
jgi:hypothetical protein